MTVTFKQLMEGYQRARIGPAFCDRIVAGDDAFRDIVDKIVTANARKHPDRDELVITEDMEALRQLCLSGKQPVFFVGATVTNGSMATNEIHFLNSRRPERDYVIMVEVE